MEQKNVFIVGARGYHYKYGGWETFVDNLVDNYDDRNTRFHISELSFKPQKSIKPRKNVTIDYINVRNLGSATMLIQTIKAFKYYLKYIEKSKIENAYIYVLGLKLGPYLILKKKKIKKLNVKIVLNPDGLEWKRAKWGYFVKRFFLLSEKLMFNHCDLLVCDSKGIIEYIENTYPKNKVPKEYIAYGTTNFRQITANEEKKILEKYKLEHDKYFAVICRMVPENNFELIIKEFMKTNIDKELVIVSNIKNNKFYNELLNKIKFDKDSRIRFIGGVYDAKALTVIRRNAFAYIHGHSAGGTNPSLLESMGIVDLNVLYDVEFNKLVGQDSCLYFNSESGNLAGLLNDIKSLEGKRESLGIKAKEIIDKQFTWQIIVQQYKEIFK